MLYCVLSAINVKVKVSSWSFGLVDSILPIYLKIEHILATDENDAVHAIKVFTISPKILNLSKFIYVNYLNSKCERWVHPEEV